MGEGGGGGGANKHPPGCLEYEYVSSVFVCQLLMHLGVARGPGCIWTRGLFGLNDLCSVSIAENRVTISANSSNIAANSIGIAVSNVT